LIDAAHSHQPHLLLFTNLLPPFTNLFINLLPLFTNLLPLSTNLLPLSTHLQQLKFFHQPAPTLLFSPFLLKNLSSAPTPGCQDNHALSTTASLLLNAPAFRAQAA